MPNHCTNRLTITTEYKTKYVSIIKSYNEVLAYPLMNIVTDYAHPTVEDVFNFIKQDEVDESNKESLLIDFNNIIPLPNSNWNYDWCVKNWGTKWNSYENVRIDDHTLAFETAWSPPFPIIQKLAKKFSPLNFHIYYIDEGGNFIGEATWLGKEKKSEIEYEWKSDKQKKYEKYVDFQNFQNQQKKKRNNQIILKKFTVVS